jgi:hypothetical protein
MVASQIHQLRIESDHNARVDAMIFIPTYAS